MLLLFVVCCCEGRVEEEEQSTGYKIFTALVEPISLVKLYTSLKVNVGTLNNLNFIHKPKIVTATLHE